MKIESHGERRMREKRRKGRITIDYNKPCERKKTGDETGVTGKCFFK